MSIQELQDVATINKDWAQLNMNSLDVANLTVRDNISGSSRFTLQFGGSLVLQPKYCNLNGDVNSNCVVVQLPENIGWIPKDCILKTVCYSTLSGAPTTSIILKKGIVTVNTHLLSDVEIGTVPSGIYDVNISFLKGDTVYVQFTGPDAGGTTVILYFE